MKIATETFGRVLVAHAPDELTDESAAAFLKALEPHIEAGQVHIVLQMDRTEVYDSQGLSALLDLQDTLREQRGNLRVSGLGDPGRKIFEMTRLHQQIDLFESVIDAVSSFR